MRRIARTRIVRIAFEKSADTFPVQGSSAGEVFESGSARDHALAGAWDVSSGGRGDAHGTRFHLSPPAILRMASRGAKQRINPQSVHAMASTLAETNKLPAPGGQSGP
jgi:hypothetical protein